MQASTKLPDVAAPSGGARPRMRSNIIELEEDTSRDDDREKLVRRRRLATLSQLRMSTTSHLPPRSAARKPASNTKILVKICIKYYLN